MSHERRVSSPTPMVRPLRRLLIIYTADNTQLVRIRPDYYISVSYMSLPDSSFYYTCCKGMVYLRLDLMPALNLRQTSACIYLIRPRLLVQIPSKFHDQQNGIARDGWPMNRQP